MLDNMSRKDFKITNVKDMCGRGDRIVARMREWPLPLTPKLINQN